MGGVIAKVSVGGHDESRVLARTMLLLAVPPEIKPTLTDVGAIAVGLQIAIVVLTTEAMAQAAKLKGGTPGDLMSVVQALGLAIPSFVASEVARMADDGGATPKQREGVRKMLMECVEAAIRQGEVATNGPPTKGSA